MASQDSHALGHVMAAKTLLAVFAALLLLTVVTVGATSIDFGPRPNLLIAMTVATAKATLVVLFFMHLLYDRRFHMLFFLGSLLFVLLFVGITLNDTLEYQPDISSRTEALQPK